MDIKPIETKYKGYRFRSRLEARWAVFFDELEWEWRYETEGYQLESGYYLPDFYFPHLNSYAEVKAKALTNEEMKKCELLSEEFGIIMLVGPPDVKSYPLMYGGEIPTELVFMPKGDKYYPYFATYDFDPEFFSETTDAVFASRAKRFEFNEREL